jgi:hypothetical protein
VRFEFSADQTWRVRAIPADLTRRVDPVRLRGQRRAALLRHRPLALHNNVPSWTSDLSWRPLPRREYTKRSDYNALAVVNRHTLTPMAGPTNSSTPRCSATPMAARWRSREFGFNDYVRSTDVDFSPARDYWKATAGYWARVRGYWERFLAQAPGYA